MKFGRLQSFKHTLKRKRPSGEALAISNRRLSANIPAADENSVVSGRIGFPLFPMSWSGRGGPLPFSTRANNPALN